MSLKNFKSRNGIDVDSYTIPNTSFQKALAANTTLTIDAIALSAFASCEYFITLKQGSKIRSSKVVMHTDGTSLDMTEYAITETGGTIAGIAITAAVSSGNGLLKVTGSDAETTTILIKGTRNINVPFVPTAPDAPTIGTATAGTQQGSITFTAPVDNGGAAITEYVATSVPGSVTATGSSSPITVLGLLAETAYRFVVSATNSAGTSINSEESNEITTPGTPRMAYFAGGTSIITWDWITTIAKINMVNDTGSELSATLKAKTGTYPPTAVWPASFSNSGVAGYVGFGPQTDGSLDKLNYETDTVSNISSVMPTPNYSYTASASNSGTAGYAWGRWTGGSDFVRGNVRKFAFSTETTTNVFNPDYVTEFGAETLFDNNHIPSSNQRGTLSNNGVRAYLLYGGRVGKLEYSTDTPAQFGDDWVYLPSYKTKTGGLSNNGVCGYFVGGESYSGVNKVSFSSDTRTTLAATLTAAADNPGTASRNGVMGYINVSETRNLDKLDYSTDTLSTISNGLPTNNGYQPAGFANDGVF
jgi:hypothetical protein